MTRVALTGATGFLGLHLLPSLLQAGFEVRILARHTPAHPAFAGLTFETVHGSLEDPAALAALVRDADMVVHAAGLIKASRAAAFFAVNQAGTARLARILRAQAPAARLLLVSSLAARSPELSPYARSKAAAEAASRAAFADAPAQLTILRPPALYGPWDRETLALFRAARHFVAPVLGRGRAAVMHVQDAAGAITALAGTWRPGLYALADAQPEGYRMRTLMAQAGQAMGAAPHLLQVPDAVILAAGAGASLAARLTGRAQIFGLGKAREICHGDWSVSPAELLPAEIFAPRIALPSGFAETAAWYATAGWL